jgi:hypothetical protein
MRRYSPAGSRFQNSTCAVPGVPVVTHQGSRVTRPGRFPWKPGNPVRHTDPHDLPEHWADTFSRSHSRRVAMCGDKLAGENRSLRSPHAGYGDVVARQRFREPWEPC